MTELEYVISNFHSNFHKFLGKTIILHGSREYAAGIIRNYHHIFQFAGLCSFEETEDCFCGIPVLDIRAANADLIILTERVRHEEHAFQAIYELYGKAGTLIYNMYGCNLIETHKKAEQYRVLTPYTLPAWISNMRSYDLIAFEATDTVTEIMENELRIRPVFKDLFDRLLKEGKRLAFSLRKSFSEDKQIEILNSVFGNSVPIVPDQRPEGARIFFIRRYGEDLSFRRVTEYFPGSRILYIGKGLVNEILLPRCYGIDTWRFMEQYDCQAPVRSEELSAAHSDQEETAGLFKENCIERIRLSDIVSFDIFDTIVCRGPLVPEDVFIMVEKQLMKAGIVSSGFSAIRKSSQQELPCGTIDQIYESVREIMGWTEAETERAKALEFRIEKEVLMPCHFGASLLKTAMSLKKRVVLTSDMYYTAGQLEELLSEAGITDCPDILVSCEAGRTKNSGLFLHLRNKGGWDSRILHFDDRRNLTHFAEEQNIEMICIPESIQFPEQKKWKECLLMASSLEERGLLWLALTDNRSRGKVSTDKSSLDRYIRYGKEVIGPILTGFLFWLIYMLQKESFDAVLFFSRDGWMLKKLYDRIREISGNSLPRSVYYYISRHSANLLCADSREVIRQIVIQAKGNCMDGEDILKRVYGLAEQDLLPRMQDEKDEDYIYRHCSILKKRRDEAVSGYIRYSKELGLDCSSQEKYAVVDLFAAGSTQKHLQSAIPFRLKGFYMGNYKAVSESSCDIQYYFCGKRESMIRNCIEIESFFTSPEPSVDHLTSEGKIVFSNEVRSGRTMDEIECVQNTAIRFAEDFFEQFHTLGAFPDPAFIETMYEARDGSAVIQSAYNDLLKTDLQKRVWVRENNQDVEY